MKIYISLPITGRPMEEVREQAERAKEAIIKMGHTPVSPLEVSPYDERKDYADYMGDDIRELLRSDGIYMCRGWQDSPGCVLEYSAAAIYDKTLFSEPEP